MLKHCSACDHDHHGPYSLYCLFMKAAKVKCLEVGSKEEDFPLYLDFTDIETTGEVHGKGGSTGTPEEDVDIDKKDKWLADLILINQDQKDSIDKLMRKLEAISMSGNVPQAMQPAGVHGGVMAASMAGSLSHPANPFLPATTPKAVTGTGVPSVTIPVTMPLTGLTGVQARPQPTGNLVTAGQAALGPSAMVGLPSPAMTYTSPGTTVSAISAPLLYGSTGIGGTNVSSVNTSLSSWSSYVLQWRIS